MPRRERERVKERAEEETAPGTAGSAAPVDSAGAPSATVRPRARPPVLPGLGRLRGRCSQERWKLLASRCPPLVPRCHGRLPFISLHAM